MGALSAATIVLLAGGRATRLPGKLSLPIDGQAMLVKVYRQLTTGGRRCIVSVREPLPPAVADAIDAPIVFDAYDNAGPLGGLATAAAHVRTPLLFAAAADLPNIDSTIIDELEQLYNADRVAAQTSDVVLPRHSDGQLEPLAALYDTQALLEHATTALGSGNRKVTAALSNLRVRYYDIPPELESMFHNVNTAADLAWINPQ